MGEAGGIAVQFALMDSGRFVVMQELDGIFDGDDVIIFFAVNAVEQDSEGGRLSRSGRARDKNDSVAQFGHIAEVGGQTERSEVRDYCGNHAHHNRATAALNKDVDAEPRYARETVGYIARPVFAKGGDGLLVVANQISGNVARVVGSETRKSRHLNWNELAVHLHLRRPAGRKNQIAD